MAIQLLSSDIVNQIAAGEVIENPSAVVKELVENSLDANSSIIEIELEQSGLKKIVIKDNGDGISKDDLLKAPLRHATSKISSFEDLYSISTMGFRGEALASIFSIAKTKIISLEKNSSQAYEISSNDISKVLVGACSRGTTIIVEELFYNTPARKKYLKSETMELKKIIDIVRRFELIHYDKKIILKHNGTILVNKPSFKTQKENLEYVLGKEIRGKLVEVNYEFRGIKIKGFIGNPTQITYSYKKNQYFFVNSRYIKSKVLSDALYSGFLSKLMTNRHPLYFLEIEIDPEIIDVNVHPTKVEIRFEDEQTIYTTMESAILETFKTSLLFKEFNQDEKKEEDVKLESFSQELEARSERVSGRVQEK
ncbi:MAG: DNA mismatch repair endonuclease MutL, partial [Nanoarchaeota archaeon]|nr:DNA mismatch repair endonuclease MutL [Nanoarchaeota archaeon]